MKSSVAAALAAAGLAHAFLVPPDVSKADVAAAEAIADQFEPVTGLILKGTERQTLNLDCPGCPVRILGKHGKVKGMAVKPNHLEISLHISHTEGQPDTLMLNNLEVYPTVDPRRPFLVAPQVVDEDDEEGQEESHEEEHKEHDEPAKEEHKESEKEEDLRRDVDVSARHVKAINRHHRKGKHHRVGAALPQRLGFGLSVQPPIVGADDSGLELIKMDLQIIEVGASFIDGIPGVHIELVRSTESGRLMIAKAETTQSQSAEPATPLDGQPKDTEPSNNPADFDRCSSNLCRWLVALRAKVQAMAKKPLAMIKGHCKGHHKGMPAPANAEAAPAAPMSPEEAAAMGSHHHAHGHHGHHRHHFKHIFKSVVAHVLLPIMVGIVAGISVSLIGVVVGTLAVSLWRLARGRPPCTRGQCPRLAAQAKAAPADAATDEEKVGLMEFIQEDLPPEYEAALKTPKQDTPKDDA